MQRIAVINQKGGVGKTTTTVNLGAALAHRGRRVLLLDMDPQANLTVHVDKRPDLESNTMTSLLVDDAKLADLVQPTSQEGLFVVPSDTSLAGVEQVLANRIGRETILREALDVFAGQGDFEFVLFDCPPSLGVLSANALVAADFVVIPMQAEYLSLQGMAKLLEVIQLVQKRLNPSVKIACVLPCMVDNRTNLSTEVLREIDTHFGPLLTRTRIRNNVKLAEAPSFGRTIFEHAPDSNGARDYASFCDEFLQMIGLAPRTEVAAEPALPAEPAPANDGGDQLAAQASPTTEAAPSNDDHQRPTAEAVPPTEAVPANDDSGWLAAEPALPTSATPANGDGDQFAAESALPAAATPVDDGSDPFTAAPPAFAEPTLAEPTPPAASADGVAATKRVPAPPTEFEAGA